MLRLALALTLLSAAACESSSGDDEPAGTPTDPVTECERVGDTCRLDDARLGVCTEVSADRAPARCAERDSCLVCMSQH